MTAEAPPIAELPILYEILLLRFSESEESFGKEVVEKAARLFGVRRLALFIGKGDTQRLIASLAFKDEKEIAKIISQNKPNQFKFAFGPEGELGTLFMEQAYPIESREQRLYIIFARQLENALMTDKEATERKRAEKELIRKTRQLEKANQAKSEFLACMSHELRTPLNAVIGFSQLMLDDVPGEINKEQRQCLDDISDSGQHLLNLVNNILDLSRVETRKIELKLEELNLTNAINDVVKTVKPMLEDNRHKLKVNIEGRLPRVRADKKRLRQILLNLLSNAIKFTPPGGELAINACTEGKWCQVSVVDNGIGIKKEDRGKIFEIHTPSTTLSGEKNEHIGLGLALAKHFVELTGGRIWVESEYSKGSKFTFTIPSLKGKGDGLNK